MTIESAMPSGTGGADGPAGLERLERPTRSVALELARLHLRAGALALARTELETLAGRDLLDDPGILDLAEVRWRTGDVAGAGEAVAALLEGSDAELGDEGAALAWVIAAEAAAAHGRPTEARRHADRLRSVPAGVIDALFAGLPRSSAWPPDPLALAPVDATLFPAANSGIATGPGAGRDGSPRTARAAGPGAAALAPVGSTASVTGAAPGFWDAEEPADDDLAAEELPEIDPELAAVAEAIAATEAHADLATPEPNADGDTALDDDFDAGHPALAVDEGRVALAAGQTALASMHLGLAIRLDPALAPAVLDVLDALGAAEADRPELALVRGDAYRLVGREREARRAYGRARPSTPTPTTDPRIDADPASAGDVPSDPDPTQGDPA